MLCERGFGLVEAVARVVTPSGPLAVRVGIHTGLVVVGEMGSGNARERLALGDTPNLAARLQALAAPGSVVLTDQTRRLMSDGFEMRDCGSHAVKGVVEPVQVWRAIYAKTLRVGSRPLRAADWLPWSGGNWSSPSSCTPGRGGVLPTSLDWARKTGEVLGAAHLHQLCADDEGPGPAHRSAATASSRLRLVH